MEISEKAKKEIIKLRNELVELKQKERQLRNKSVYSTDKFVRKRYRREANKISTKILNKEDKINKITRKGYSTSEIASLKRELSSFKPLSYKSSLGIRDFTKVGYSKALGSYVIIDGMKMTSFMRSVRGMSSQSGKISIDSIKKISKSQYERILNQEKRESRRKTSYGRSRAPPEPMGLNIFNGIKW